MKVATFNANSLRARLPIVLDWLAQERPDVLAVQETKVVDEQFPRAAFEEAGWRVVFRGQKGYNGVAFVARLPPEEVETRLHPSDAAEEARFLCARWGGVLVVNTYVPQGFEVDSEKFKRKLRFFADLKERFARLVDAGRPALWVGDLNVAPMEIDLWDPVRNAEHVCFHPRARKAFEEVRAGVWTDLFREQVKEPGHYTFWDYLWPSNFEKNRGWRIDHILGTRPMAARLKRVWIDKEPRRREKPSDHTFLAAEFDD